MNAGPLDQRVTLERRGEGQDADRLVHEGRVYGIESVVDVRAGKRELVLMCRG